MKNDRNAISMFLLVFMYLVHQRNITRALLNGALAADSEVSLAFGVGRE